MDDLQLLHTTRNDVGTIPPATLARGRERLMRATQSEAAAQHHEDVFMTSHETTRRSTQVRFRRGFTLVAAAAVFLTGVLVVSDVVLPDPQPLSAEAAAVLEDAAAATIRTSDPVVLPGQYLKVETDALTGASSVADGQQISWQVTTTDELYIPADTNREWIWNRQAPVPTETAPEAVKEAARLQPTVDPATYAALTGVFRAPGGAFGKGEQYTIIGAPLTDTDDLPRDPQALLDRIYEHTKGAGKTPDLEAFETIVESLRTGIIPADLRAAFYQAAALIPGVEVMDRQATIDGRTGIAIGKATPEGGSRQDIIIDPASGLVIGEQIVILQDYPGSPAGVVESWTSVQTTVVDSAP
ncbi:CU044_5270 family protein [Arthrobacter pityocampae]|uniref:CU044_5270 family protein n=1 Tax=Arthrobacter pityocampae TaxID=547334 RepID=UPI003736633F